METLEEQVAGLTARLEQNDQRAVVAALRTELTSVGAIHPDVGQIVTKHHGDSIKVDAATGDVLGVKDAVAALKAKSPALFKATASVAPTKLGAKLPDLRTLDASERGAAIRDFREGVRTEGKTEMPPLADLRTMSKRERSVAVGNYRRGFARRDAR